MSDRQDPKKSVGMGILLITTAFACVAAMSAFGKGAAGVSTGTLVFFQNFISLILFAPWFLRGGVGRTADVADPAPHYARRRRIAFPGAYVRGCKENAAG